MKKIYCTFILIISTFCYVVAQNDTIKYHVDFIGVASSAKYAPFWLQSNQYGIVSSSPFSVATMVGLNKDFAVRPRLFDYGFKANLLLNTDTHSANAYLHEYYLKARFWVFDFILGAREDHYGNQDSILSTGGFLFSPNTRPMPKVTIGIEHFTAIPFTGGNVEVKGALSHGWYTDNIYVKDLLFHHKYIYVRVGGSLPVRFQYGFDHVAQWGGNVPGYGQQPAGWRNFVNVFYARAGSTDASTTDQFNTLGNHIVSQSMKLDVDISDYKIAAYWQKISEDGPIKNMWNAPNSFDGLWGLSVRSSNFPIFKAVVLEYLNTTDQSGPYLDKDGIIYGGGDSYFNNDVYKNGWTYYSRTMGTPFISSPLYNKDGSVSVVNNRVQVFHLGLEGNVNSYYYKLLSSYSRNFGRYVAPYPEMVPNSSSSLELMKQFPMLSNLQIGCTLGADIGKLYGNSFGFMLKLRKTGDLIKY
jgi:hypothetical protein